MQPNWKRGTEHFSSARLDTGRDNYINLYFNAEAQNGKQIEIKCAVPTQDIIKLVTSNNSYIQSVTDVASGNNQQGSERKTQAA